MRFGAGDHEPQTLSQAGKKLGVSTERARQLEERALRKLSQRPELIALRRGRVARARRPLIHPRPRPPPSRVVSALRSLSGQCRAPAAASPAPAVVGTAPDRCCWSGWG